MYENENKNSEKSFESKAAQGNENLEKASSGNTSENVSKNQADSTTEKSKLSKAGSFSLSIVPFILFCLGIALISVFLFKEYVEKTNLWRFIVNTNAVATPEGDEDDFSGEYIGGSMEDLSFETVSKPDNSEDTSGVDENQIYYNKKDFPGYKWGELWAKLSIPSIGLENKKVYVGESNAIYKKGIGKRFGTRFPGQGGNIVLGAHVTREFYDLQELIVGDRVIIETEYGVYVYEVYETVIFSIDDYHYVMNYDEGEKLTLYTCHPRGSAYRTERFGVLCKKISGPEWIEVE